MGRLGIIASSRVAPRAVDRNRVKRMAREEFRVARRRLGGLDVIVQLRRRPGRETAAARAELGGLLEALAARVRDR
jgi:ribonuclease P protein component